jgi:hypothetical protein
MRRCGMRVKEYGSVPVARVGSEVLDEHVDQLGRPPQSPSLRTARQVPTTGHGLSRPTRAAHSAAERGCWPTRRPRRAAHHPAGGRWPHPRRSGPRRCRAAAAVPRPPSDPAAGRREATGGPRARRQAHPAGTHHPRDGPPARPPAARHALVLAGQAVGEQRPLPEGFPSAGSSTAAPGRSCSFAPQGSAQPARAPVHRLAPRASRERVTAMVGMATTTSSTRGQERWPARPM